MSFHATLARFAQVPLEELFSSIILEQVQNVLPKDQMGELDLLTLLSPAAAEYLEPLAQKAHGLSLQHFGRAILLYTPMYISNWCVNRCVYCGFNAHNSVTRKKLSLAEVEVEAQAIAQKGLRHILILTGESRKHSPVAYIAQCVQVLKKYFTSISIEIYPLEEAEYRELAQAGVDGMTIYQETYNPELYDRLHLSGPKKNYSFRLDAPERACRANLRTVNIGALLGLDQWRQEVFFTGIHAKYLQDKYPAAEISVSFPRMRPHAGDFQPHYDITDRDLVQAIVALRLFLPHVGITLSTRESAQLRDNLIPLGITKMSADSTTAVGGHTQGDDSTGQFAVSDQRGVAEIYAAILERGYQPIFKDWWMLG